MSEIGPHLQKKEKNSQSKQIISKLFERKNIIWKYFISKKYFKIVEIYVK